MAKYVLTDYEINGYDDSDFMLTYWDDVEKKVLSQCYASTRYGGCMCKPKPVEGGSRYHLCGNACRSDRHEPEVLLWPTADKVEEAREWLEGYIFNLIVKADERLVNEPDYADLHEGLEVRLLTDCKMHVVETEACSKCSGTGKWVNPKNLADKRDCFGCKGSGQCFKGKAKTAEGKQAFKKLSAGIHGKVVDWRAFGQFYAGGYSKPDRHNTTVQFKLDNGEVVRAALKNLRLHRDYIMPSEALKRARNTSYEYQFSAIGPKFAWDTYNYAARVVRSHPVTDST